MIEPVIEALTTSMRPAWRAKKAMMSSATLPKVAFRIPPTCGPVTAPRRSVARPTTQARPRIAAAATTKISDGLPWRKNSRATAAAATPSVARIAILAGVESGPRIGRLLAADWLWSRENATRMRGRRAGDTGVAGGCRSRR